MKSSGEIDCHFYQVIVSFPFNIKAEVGGRWAACLLKEVVLHETIIAKEGIFFFFLIRERGFVYVPGFCGAGGGCSRVRNLFISVLEI